MNDVREDWPELRLEKWDDTRETLHRLTQIVGKIRLSRMPWTNHSWHATLYVTVRGLTTLPLPGNPGFFQLDFDFIDHLIRIQTSAGAVRKVPLRSISVAELYRELLAECAEAGVMVRIHGRPNEIEPDTPFALDSEHASYDPEYAERFRRILLQAQRVFQIFRARFLGKASPVHFFWGSFDLAVTRFSGRRAPPHPGGVPHLPDWITREAYSHEVSSAGFWPGGGAHPFPLFYSYAYPEPEGFRERKVQPSDAFYSPAFREFVLPYDAVRQADDPDRALLEFLQGTYEAAAEAGGWDRKSLECGERPPGLRPSGS